MDLGAYAGTGDPCPRHAHCFQSVALPMEHEQLTGTVIGCAMKVHTTLGPGFLESVYHNALAHELRKRGVLVELKKRVLVRYDGVVVGDYEVDMLVEGRVLVENKAIRALTPRDEA